MSPSISPLSNGFTPLHPEHAKWKSSSAPHVVVSGNTTFYHEPNPLMKHVTPTLTKTIRFRALTLFTTLGLTWLLTGNPVTSISLTILQQSTNTAMYYYFEQKEKTNSRMRN